MGMMRSDLMVSLWQITDELQLRICGLFLVYYISINTYEQQRSTHRHRRSLRYWWSHQSRVLHR